QGNLVTGNTGWSGVMSQGGIVVRNGGSLNVPTTPIIEDNTVANNNIGITIGSQSSQTISPIILNNNIYSNQKYNFYLKQVNFNVSVTDNWWGTNDVQTINQTIYDFKNDFNLGNVTFIPVLTVADPAAPLADYNPNPTPTPSPTPTPTPSPTPSPSPNPAPTANPTPSPSPLSPSTTTSTPTPTGSPTPISTSSIPEFSSSVIFSIFTISTISAVIALMIRKRR
ncbi:MAG TPA: hypothetical protein VLU95_03890, partial [Candidatus Acidoferrum sp.]|nr:hypothetical protein [Candidatus Acidoferrum sp.]